MLARGLAKDGLELGGLRGDADVGVEDKVSSLGRESLHLLAGSAGGDARFGAGTPGSMGRLCRAGSRVRECERALARGQGTLRAKQRARTSRRSAAAPPRRSPRATEPNSVRRTLTCPRRPVWASVASSARPRECHDESGSGSAPRRLESTPGSLRAPGARCGSFPAFALPRARGLRLRRPLFVGGAPFGLGEIQGRGRQFEDAVGACHAATAARSRSCAPSSSPRRVPRVELLGRGVVAP